MPGNGSFVAGNGSSVATYELSVAGNDSFVIGNGSSVEGNVAFVVFGGPSVADNGSFVAVSNHFVAGNGARGKGNDAFRDGNEGAVEKVFIFKMDMKVLLRGMGFIGMATIGPLMEFSVSKKAMTVPLKAVVLTGKVITVLSKDYSFLEWQRQFR